ncbi:sulfite exporter TauE/SafE family protein [Thalassotalea sp. LPB0316]|uniref:sulfite exporter TauE/SafE family protein n=1 Tax=Thalassotalea sp. LPB0316 TaxID=2769490 RepID=UPI0018688725|nr:sulfite exporter TauE/SafE family protein [Thalassotalea sp. LPB0316]QOL25554.1 sulfite exporter TauE/SafE family protein [Thalassotalea sp. LPB0316]
MLALTIILVCAILGMSVGFLAGLLGIGGGLIIVPALVYLLPIFGIEEHLVLPISLATSLAAIVVTSSSAAFAHHKNGNIPWQLTKPLMVAVSVGAITGSYIAELLSAKALTSFFAGAVLVLAIYMLISIKVERTKPYPKQWKVNVIGVITGVIGSLMGISGGVILIPTLSYLSIPVRQAIGMATACGLMVALFGSIGFVLTGTQQTGLPQWSLGYIYLPALLGIISTSFLFAPVGVKLATKLPVRTLKKLFASFLMLLAIEMLLS